MQPAAKEPYQTEDMVIKHHGSPYYFNAGEILVIVLIRALEVTLGLMLWSAVLVTYNSIVGKDNVAAAWISLVIVFVIVFFIIILLSHCKKRLMKWAHLFDHDFHLKKKRDNLKKKIISQMPTKKTNRTNRGKASRKQTRKHTLKGRGKKQNVEFMKRTKKTQIHWRDQTPMTKKARSQMPSHCLLDPTHLRYPVCKTGSSHISCIGLKAAEKRARLQRDEFIQSKAKILQKMYC